MENSLQTNFILLIRNIVQLMLRIVDSNHIKSELHCICLFIFEVNKLTSLMRQGQFLNFKITAYPLNDGRQSLTWNLSSEAAQELSLWGSLCQLTQPSQHQLDRERMSHHLKHIVLMMYFLQWSYGLESKIHLNKNIRCWTLFNNILVKYNWRNTYSKLLCSLLFEGKNYFVQFF